MQRFKAIPADQFRITVPTIVTLVRLAFIPCIIVAMIMHHWGYAFALFLLAAATDSIDGFLARWLKCHTLLGAALDAIADKLLVISIFTTLAFIKTPLFSIPRWFVGLVLLKELILIIGSFIIFYAKKNIAIKPTVLGKLTMFAQICFIIWLFACYFFSWMPIKTYYTMLGLLLGLVASSLIDYGYTGYWYYKKNL